MKLPVYILSLCSILQLNSILIYSQNGNSNYEESINFIYSEKLFPKVELRDAKGSIELWTREIVSDMKKSYSFNNLFIQSISKVDKAFIDHRTDLIAMSSFEYLLNIEKLKSLIPIIITADKGVVGIEYLILAHKESNFNSLSALENQTISFIDDYSNAIPQIWLDVLLKQNNLPISNKFFNNIEVSSNANQAILKTFFKQVGACIVPKNLYESSAEINPQLASNLMIIKQSEPFIVGVVCAHKKMDKDIRNDVIQSAKKILKTIKGKQFSIFFRVGEVIEYKSEHIANVRKLVKDAKRFNIKLNR